MDSPIGIRRFAASNALTTPLLGGDTSGSIAMSALGSSTALGLRWRLGFSTTGAGASVFLPLGSRTMKSVRSSNPFRAYHSFSCSCESPSSPFGVAAGISTNLFPLASAQAVIAFNSLDPTPCPSLVTPMPVIMVAPARLSDRLLSSSNTLNPAVATGSSPFLAEGIKAPFSCTIGSVFLAGAGVSATGSSTTGSSATGAGASFSVSWRFSWPSSSRRVRLVVPFLGKRPSLLSSVAPSVSMSARCFWISAGSVAAAAVATSTLTPWATGAAGAFCSCASACLASTVSMPLVIPSATGGSVNALGSSPFPSAASPASVAAGTTPSRASVSSPAAGSVPGSLATLVRFRLGLGLVPVTSSAPCSFARASFSSSSAICWVAVAYA